MSTSQRGRGNDTERERHIASAETVGFATTAATMLLGLVAGAEAREHEAQDLDQQTPTPHPPSPAPAQPAQMPAHAEAAPAHDAPVAASAHAAASAEGAAVLPVVHQSAPVGGHATGGGHFIAPAAPPLIEHHETASSAHAALHAPAPLAPPALQIDTGMLAQHQEPVQPPALPNGALTDLSQIGETVNATLEHVTATLTSDLAHVTDGLSALTSSLTSSLSGLSPLAAHAAVETPHIDTAGAVPVAFLQVPPVQLGFLGQPTADGHDTHDGAFSALGLHHF